MELFSLKQVMVPWDNECRRVALNVNLAHLRLARLELPGSVFLGKSGDMLELVGWWTSGLDSSK